MSNGFFQQSSYHIKVTRKTMKMLEALKRSDRQAHDAIKEKIEGLKHEPRPDGTKKLKLFKSAYRLKYKNYRIIYDINDDSVTIIVCLIGNRKEVYEKLSRLDIESIRKIHL